MKQIGRVGMLLFVAGISLAAGYGQDKKGIHIAFTGGFWGDRVSYVRCNGIDIMKKVTLETNEPIGLARLQMVPTTDTTIAFEALIMNFKSDEIDEYVFSIPLRDVTWIEFYMELDRSICKRVLRYRTHQEELPAWE